MNKKGKILKTVAATVLLSLLAVSAQAKELYMTVRRDYSPQEKAAIELVYYSTGPIQLRVLAPKDLKAFIASQMDLRRAWREPKVHFNPMFFLAEGMNSTSFNTDWLREGMDWRVRKQIPGMGGAGLTNGSPMIPPGPEKVISAPEAFNLVTEQIIVPEVQDKVQPFDVPGFDSWFGTHGSLKTKVIELPKLEPGFYVVQTIQGENEGQVVVVINDIAAQLQQTTGKGVYQVARRNGEPLAGASVSVRNLQGEWVAQGKTDDTGKWTAETKETDLVTLVEAPKAGAAIIDSEFFPTTAVFPDLYLYTDRPMYRKGDTVSFRGILRERQAGISRLTETKAGAMVKVELVSVDGKPAAKSTQVKVTPYGTFSGSFKLASEGEEEGGEGVFRVVASVAGKNHIGELRVKDYVKPVFFVTVQSQQETARAGETITAKFKAERYAGGVPAGAKAKAQLFRIKMETPQWIDDAGLGETGSKVTYGFDRGSSASANLPILIEEKADIEMNARAEGEVSFTLPKELPGAPGFDYKFQLKISIVDADEHFASGSATFLDLNSEVTAQARFNKILAEGAKGLELNVRATTPSGGVFPNAKGNVEFLLTPYGGSPRSVGKREIQVGTNGLLRLDAPETGNGELRAVVVLKDGAGRPSTTEASVIVAANPPEKGVINVPELKLITEDATTQAGATVRLLAVLPEAWGEKGGNKGNLYLTVAGRTIFESRVIPVSGLGKWIEQKVDASWGSAMTMIVSYVDPVNGWVERRANFRIMEPSHGLRVSVIPENPSPLPGEKQTVTLKVVDHQGKPVQAELSLAVVDKSVLDLQPEIRPALLDFFYPTDRLNLMVFLSSQFQGYGYVEKVARLFKPNYWFAATKSPTDVLDQKDTAYWVGNLVTDAKGEVKTAFKLPGNQTIWRAIAIAADTNGRFGEGQNDFKSNMPVSMILGYPQFIRRGDEAVIRVNLTAQKTTTPVTVDYKMTAPAGLILSAPLAMQTKLTSGEQKSKTTKIMVSPSVEPKTFQLVSQMKVSTSDLSFGNSLRVASDLTDQPRSFEPAGGKISVKLGAIDTLRSAVLRVTSGLYGSLVPAMRWLIRYPYGCVEQLTSSTIPNLVFGGVLSKQEKVLSKEEKELLKNAQAFGKAGLTHLEAYQRKNGSFGWFASENEGDVTMTLLVMQILAGVQNAQHSEINRFQKSFEFLRQQNLAPASSQGIVLSYIDSVMKKVWAGSRQNDQAMIPVFKNQGDWALSSEGSVTDRALLAMAIKNWNIKDSGVEAVRAKLVAALKQSLAALPNAGAALKVRWSPGQTAAWAAYPGSMGSTIALVGRALNEVATPAERPAQLAETVRKETLRYFNGESFGSTFETSNILIHSQWIIEEELRAARRPSASGAITLNGQALKETSGARRPTFGGFEIELDPKQLGKSAEIGVGSLDQTSVVRVVARVGTQLSETKPVSSGWSLDRKYFKLADKGAKTPFDPAKDRVKVGDLLYVQIDFNRLVQKGSYWSSRYYILTEQIPAGFQIVEEDKVYEAAPYSLPIRGAGYRVREPGADQMRWYFDFSRGWMDRGQSVGFVMRANYAGRYHSGVTKILDFYHDDQFAQTASTTVTIDPQAAGQ